MKEQEKADGGESQVGLLLFGQAASTEPYSAERRDNPCRSTGLKPRHSNRA
ncbi:hypothetical protein HGO34_24770 [Agrobacterium vitis]|uniref:Uncharacterized protein n=1 Tax=Agrobacterium vitis TaxID=373 RepID=A0AAE4WFP9_AGRVI|nr:hypothetical protein [Agrobacterium vitis]MCM2442919.1 hypothetical protein [Agrobacterium vitis]MUZ58858.1 hypothetical protein [Agrobacterium vitis]MVA66493.1 hypothetical protein [Agrobacterium vitis]MVA88530.1 hypothetical protein [Agrobacterium vitis]